jgi:hypothetical protein
LGVGLEQCLKPLAAALGHGAHVPPSASGAGGGLDEGDGVRVLGEGLGARTDLFAAVTAWFLALHVLALPYLCDLVTSGSISIAEKQAWARRRGHALREDEGREVMSWGEALRFVAEESGQRTVRILLANPQVPKLGCPTCLL